MTDFAGLLRRLGGAGVEFIVVGGAAATAHGSARLTLDLDVVYRRTLENLRRVVESLSPVHPYLRGAPPGLPFRWDVETLTRGLNFTLTTDLGAIDLLGEIAGGGRYEALLPTAETISIFGVECRCLSLRQLIAVKRAAGRVKDLEALAELEAIAEERRESDPDA
jgi:predicted nucleotidyltransferase